MGSVTQTTSHVAAGELANELERLSRASVMVLGDVTLERRVHGHFADSEDAGIMMLGKEEAAPGAGAAIVHALSDLRVATAFICVLGDDLPGAQLTALIGAQPNVEPWLLVDGAKATTTETCYVDQSRTILRTIRQDVRPMQPSLRERMLRIAADAMTATSVTVLSDRGHGTLDAVSIEQLLAGARQVGRRVIADIENTAGSVARYRGCDVMIRITTDGDPPAAAESLRLAAEAGTVLLVRPEGGLAIADRDGARMVATGTWLGNAGNYERIVAALAASLAVGRSAQTACLTAWSIIRPATPS